jgi:hypothetical protein
LEDGIHKFSLRTTQVSYTFQKQVCKCVSRPSEFNALKNSRILHGFLKLEYNCKNKSSKNVKNLKLVNIS